MGTCTYSGAMAMIYQEGVSSGPNPFCILHFPPSAPPIPPSPHILIPTSPTLTTHPYPTSTHLTIHPGPRLHTLTIHPRPMSTHPHYTPPLYVLTLLTLHNLTLPTLTTHPLTPTYLTSPGYCTGFLFSIPLFIGLGWVCVLFCCNEQS